MEASLRFYVEGLGFKLIHQWTPRGTIEWCWLERDAVAVMLQQPRSPIADQTGPPGAGVTIYYQCEDALALYQEFHAKGLESMKSRPVTIIQPLRQMPYGREFYIADLTDIYWVF